MHSAEHHSKSQVQDLQNMMCNCLWKWRQIATATKNDRELHAVTEKIKQPGDLKLSHQYQNFKEEFTMMDGVLMKGGKLVVATSMRQEMTNLVKVIWAKKNARGELETWYICLL